jgi:hypothetical protein
MKEVNAINRRKALGRLLGFSGSIAAVPTLMAKSFEEVDNDVTTTHQNLDLRTDPRALARSAPHADSNRS